MTAQLVTQTERRDLTATIAGMECPALEGTYPAAHLQRSTAGQLWEREAERQAGDPVTGEISPRLSYALFMARSTRGPVAGYVRERGERRGVASGVIEAGEVREHTLYRHTGFEAGAL